MLLKLLHSAALLTYYNTINTWKERELLMQLCPSSVHYSPRGRTTSTATCQCLLRDRQQQTAPFSHDSQLHRTNGNLSGGLFSFHACYFWISPTWRCTLILIEMVRVQDITLHHTDECRMVIRARNCIRAASPSGRVTLAWLMRENVCVIHSPEYIYIKKISNP